MAFCGEIPLKGFYLLKTFVEIIMKKLIYLLILAVILVSGCSSSNTVDKEIMALINENLRAAQHEDLKAYMVTIHPKTPAYALTESGMKYLFNTFDLSYELDDI